MSQFPGAFGDQYGDQVTMQSRKASRLAVTALVSSLVAIIPCCGVITAPLGVVLGAIAFAVTGPTAPRRGRGLALSAIIIGAILCVVWGASGFWVKDKYDRFMYAANDLPPIALNAGYAGDPATFKAQFHGAGAAASDAEVQAFITELQSRYGTFNSGQIDQRGQTQPRFGDPIVPLPYTFSFDSAALGGQVEVVIVDQQSGSFVFQLGSMTIRDPKLGDLEFPPKATGRTGGATTTPAKPAAKTSGDKPSGSDNGG